jgi:hypothetical protein
MVVIKLYFYPPIFDANALVPTQTLTEDGLLSVHLQTQAHFEAALFLDCQQLCYLACSHVACSSFPPLTAHHTVSITAGII